LGTGRTSTTAPEFGDFGLNLIRGVPTMANFRRLRTDAATAAWAEATNVVA
jgi:hypothetical protein